MYRLRIKITSEQRGALCEQVRNHLAGVGWVRGQAEDEATRQRQRLAKLGEEREKLLHAYYAGAVPVDLLAASRTGYRLRPRRRSGTSK